MIACKATTSDRTVRGVSTRLQADGHLVVRPWWRQERLNDSYTVVTGDRVIYSPGQNAPDSLCETTQVTARP